MSSKAKALFFDVDGTLLDEKTRQIPRSAVLALEKARSRGHMVWVNSGRAYCQLEEIRGMIQADGYLCGCGTQVVAKDRVLYHYSIPHEQGIQMKKDIVACGLDGVLEASQGCYMQKGPSRFPQVEHLRQAMSRLGVLRSQDWTDHSYDFDKCYLASDEKSRCRELFGRMKHMEIIDRGEGFYECVPRGHSKATAIEMVLRAYGISLDDVYVFGDSSNDLPMFQYARNCIAMGDHSPVLEPYASFVTRNVEEDGIAFALEHFGII